MALNLIFCRGLVQEHQGASTSKGRFKTFYLHGGIAPQLVFGHTANLQSASKEKNIIFCILLKKIESYQYQAGGSTRAPSPDILHIKSLDSYKICRFFDKKGGGGRGCSSSSRLHTQTAKLTHQTIFLLNLFENHVFN